MDLRLETEFSKAEIFQEIDALKKQIDDMRPLPEDVEGRVMQKLRLDWNYHSNAIEGNKLSYGETVAFLMEGITAKGKPLKDHLDLRGHNEAINFLMSIVKDSRPLSEADIRSLHEMILVEPYESKAKTPDGLNTTKRITLGEYKTSPNHVKTTTGEIHYYSTPEETSAKMQELMEWYSEASANKAIHPLVIAALFHHKFVAIHPFDDGNGRLSRILMNWILMQNEFPPVIILLDDSKNYYSLLEKADNNDLWPFVEFIVNTLKSSTQLFSNWKAFRYQIKISGIISEESKKIIDGGFKVKGNANCTLDLLCFYSELEIPIGATFNYFEKNDTQTPLKDEAILVAVTQQFGKSFDVIPTGWKTISRFQFSEKDMRDLKNELPILDSWDVSHDKFYLLRKE